MKRALLSAALVLIGCGDGNEQFRPLAIGHAAPAYATRTLDGDSVAVGAGEPLTLLHIWATWFGPCKDEFPDIEALHRDYGSRGVRILEVSIDGGGDEKVRRFVEEPGNRSRARHAADGKPGRCLARRSVRAHLERRSFTSTSGAADAHCPHFS